MTVDDDDFDECEATGETLAKKKQKYLKKTCLSAALFTTNPT
jgi:hypothetical protein